MCKSQSLLMHISFLPSQIYRKKQPHFRAAFNYNTL
ncbi:hypothetical protein CF65_02464 [Aggregatibacter actinomycetemcomitans HK1651]|nr:hypothetical protein CF65_02464 [Aggregatibacter actinomycetemcomitans HK1651]